MYNTHFEEAKDLDQYWLFQDCIKSVKRDLYFSISTRYFCDAGCKVCYIQDNLTRMKTSLGKYYFDFDDAMEERWEKVFDYYDYLRTDDDVMFLKLNYPKHYNWFVRNGHRFEYGMTDNQIFRYRRYAEELKFKGVASISLSSSFAESANSDKLMSTLKEIHISSPIQQLKMIDCGDMNTLRPYYDWAKENNIETMFHYNFLQGYRELLTYDWVDQQVTWIDADTEGNMQVYGDEAVCLFFDRFFFSNDVATDSTVDPYYILDKEYSAEAFLVAMARGKQELYNRWKDRTKNEKFKDYFAKTQNYRFNDIYNFIPSMMMVPFSRYCSKLEQTGWLKTPRGLYLNNGETLKSFVEKI
jgi:hypothetical protein